MNQEKSIRQRLTNLFEQVEPAFQKDTIDRYIAHAKAEHTAWIKLLKGPEPPRDRFYYMKVSIPHYVTWKGAFGSSWQAKVDAIDEFKCNKKKATSDAIAAVRDAKSHFIEKQTRKITNATRLRKDRPTIKATLRYEVRIEGVMKFKYPNGDSFALHMGMIVNYRHTRGFTSFHQFPARFKDVILNGEPVKARLSESWMSQNFK